MDLRCVFGRHVLGTRLFNVGRIALVTAYCRRCRHDVGAPRRVEKLHIPELPNENELGQVENPDDDAELEVLPLRHGDLVMIRPVNFDLNPESEQMLRGQLSEASARTGVQFIVFSKAMAATVIRREDN